MRNLVIFFLLTSFLLGQEEPESKPDPSVTLNNAAVALLKKGDYDGAIKKLRRACDLRKIARQEVEPVFTKNLVTALLGKASKVMSVRDFAGADRLILEAKRTGPKNPLITAYEGVLAFRRGYMASATTFLNDALRANSKLGVAHEFLGMIHYKAERLPKAIKSWKAAIKVAPQRQKHLGPMIAKAERELKVESKMQTLRSTHFICKFSDAQNRSIANEILKMLEDAYSKVGSELRLYPNESLTAVLYVDREFRGATRAQGWAAGIFDGKIRVPIRNFERSRIPIRSTLIHEYTHFAVSKIARRVPAWLNEGLAQRMEGIDAEADSPFLRGAKERETLKKFQLLSASFATLKDRKTVRLAYSQSLSFVGFLEREYGMSRLVSVLRRMGKGMAANSALLRVMGRDLSALEKLWVAQL